jgi:hypothetical protein
VPLASIDLLVLDILLTKVWLTSYAIMRPFDLLRGIGCQDNSNVVAFTLLNVKLAGEILGAGNRNSRKNLIK